MQIDVDFEQYFSQLELLPSGTLPLFPKKFFPWDALPYPQQHAELGTWLLQKEASHFHELAYRMSSFQEATLDHNKKPIFPFFQQEGKGNRTALEKATLTFFEMLGQKPKDHFQFSEPTLGLFSKRSLETTLMCAGSGCKSGMGYYVHQNAGVVNFGPQLFPLGNSDGFGLAGRAQNLCFKETEGLFELFYSCRLAAPHTRATGLDFLEDSGYSGLWMEAEMKGNLENFSFKSHFEGTNPLGRLLFVFFGKGEACLVAHSIKLNPRSLDRYQGPPQQVAFLDKSVGVSIEALEGIAKMEIIPLAGDSNFWGADFLVGYTLNATDIQFALKRESVSQKKYAKFFLN